jgi:ABC-type Fe3+/spermidine/putrescine transport system ATPase subunit
MALSASSGITLHELGKAYGGVTAVTGVSLAIAPGEFVTLLGPSGSGKTTTLRMIAGLEQPTHGSVRIGDRQVSGDGIFIPVHERRLGMVFQSYAVWPHKTVLENVIFPLQQMRIPRSEQDSRADAMLQLVGLGGYARRYPSQLSGGQQQRVALARALVAEPDVILFDEPLSNLDAQLRDSMRVLLRDLHRRIRITAVYVTHDQVEAMVLSDRVFVMHEGKLVQSGTPEDLYERPGSRFVAEFVGAANVLPLLAVDVQAGTAVLESGATLRVATVAKSVAERALVIRPHRVRIATADERDNVLPATIVSIVYLGDRLRIAARIDGGGELLLDAVPGTIARLQEGQQLRLRLPADACIVV